MKKITSIALLTAGILLSLTGCQKGTGVDNSDKIVRFSASTGYETRTAYSGVLDTDKKIERIDWSAGDEIMIWSDNATVRPSGTPYFSGNDKLAVYKIGSITASGEKSIAAIVDENGGGLLYPDNDPGSIFWGVYPASAVKESPVNNSVPFAIEAEQALTANGNTNVSYDYAPDMQQAVMLAYVSGAKASAPSVEIPFKPAFTDFEFNLEIPADDETAADYSVTITAIEFNSTSTALSGGFTATCTDGTWGYTIADDAAKTVKATLGEGLTLDKDNPKLTLNIFALPQNLTDLKVTFYTTDGNKTLKLLAQDKTTWLTFTGGKKHRLNGIILPTNWYFSYITLDLKVLEWQAIDVTGTSAEFPQATQFAVSGEGVKNGYKDINHGLGEKDPFRQQWYFMKGQTVTVFFKIMLPVNGTWKLEPVGGVEGTEVALSSDFVFTNAYDRTKTGDAALTGAIDDSGNTAVKIEITYTGDDPASFFFHSYAIKDGIKYNIDSETQIYDVGRGYHTFFVNNPAYNN